MIQKNTRLSKGQRNLYILVCEKIKTDQILLFKEAKDIYVKFVNAHVVNGVPYHYYYWVPIPNEPGHYTSELRPMTEDEINFTSLKWLTMALGALILKGYLTVMPAVDLRLLK
jgi:hypothetical protein